MTSKTQRNRKIFIEVARELFAQHGKSHVTMFDIAEKSQKGRRTLYTYFNNKDEIYRAIIENELDYILQMLDVVQKSACEPEVKLTQHIITHLDAVKKVVSRNGSLRADFFRNIYEVERIRRNADRKEIELIKNILIAGVKKGVFKRMNIEFSAMIIFYTIKGLEVPYIRKNLSEEFENNKNSIVDFVLRGIVVNQPITSVNFAQ